MSSLHRPGARRRAIALALITLTVGCTSWQTAQVTPQVLLETEKPKSVRVTAHDTRQMVRGPRIASDTLRGLRGWQGKDSVAVALRDLTRMEVSRYSPGRTTGLVVGMVVVVGGLIAAFVAMQSIDGITFGGN